MSYVGLDFETYGAVSLPVHGLEQYVNNKTFMPLIGSLVDEYKTHDLDFVVNRTSSTRLLRDLIGGSQIVAHNAGFEAAVCNHLGLDYPASRFIDSAMVARAAGAGSHLEAAAPQLLGVDKLESGKNLIKMFSIPGKYQYESGSMLFDTQVIKDNPGQWAAFVDYCRVDARLGLDIVRRYEERLTKRELRFAEVTMAMNEVGWCVDIPLVEEMQRRYLENQEQALFEFRDECDALDLNLSSNKQLREWCLARGVKATSFDEAHVASLLVRIEKKIATMGLDDPKLAQYCDVRDLLRTKQVLGGSSLKKLQVILDTAIEDTWNPGRHRLKDQYVHCGAGQTLRTTGRSVQMQNLKRLSDVADMGEIYDDAVAWDNDRLAENIRQAFTATDPNGRLVVGDFKSVESRGLAWLAGEEWKLDAYRAGRDMYKVLAATPEMFGVDYDAVTKEQRQSGKVGELSCGYGAGGEAVQEFAAKMGVPMSLAEASQLVFNWRAACPKTLELWERLDRMLHRVVEGPNYNASDLLLPDGFVLRMRAVRLPISLEKMHPSSVSVMLQVVDPTSAVFLKRFFHGCYPRGRNICYYKPSDRKTGDVWRDSYVHPKTKQLTYHSLYGGKLAGILTQSFCRELFMQSLLEVHQWCQRPNMNVVLVGQFHDEIVLDWKPGFLRLKGVKAQLEIYMSDPGRARSFPLAADVKDDYRYTK